MSTLGFIGSGNIGSRLARLAVAAGIDVVMSNSRGPASLAEKVAALGARARAATPEEAAEAGDWVVASIPLAAYRQLPAAGLAGKVVLDTTNYYPFRDGHFEELDSGRTTSSELVQAQIRGAHLVKAFSNVGEQHLTALARPSGAAGRSALPIAGDSPEAKARAAALIDRLGFDTVDAGPLAEGWRFEPETTPYVMPYFSDPEAFARSLVELGEELRSGGTVRSARPVDAGAPLPADRLRTLLRESTRKLPGDRVLR
ncbi:NADPH-dependent F420 reductase [Streptomyces fuscigenes]|uniref:NADPH-dependent F420 reductase n=1 Tax=Streptomyces fuscigenes TaxID=1528880 RepID=UPI001F2AD99D|nr:NAD(P)-binding domain-containing protein [Streptomyces fuscigenes]MCF3963774.1 NAD(P)-binding domain-containing protein [Streptomyces fuscigenes]